jgi:hypothetical protein
MFEANKRHGHPGHEAAVRTALCCRTVQVFFALWAVLYEGIGGDGDN